MMHFYTIYEVLSMSSATYTDTRKLLEELFCKQAAGGPCALTCCI